MGQVNNPGKYYIRSESITVREAIVEAGLPINGSALHRARLINTDKDNNIVIRIVDLNALLYKGDMQYNLEMHSGDQLYVPTTQEEMDYVQTAGNAGVNTVGNDSPVLKLVEEPEPAGLEDVVYKLGPDDGVKVTVQGHPEISGDYYVNLEGKIQMEMAGDVYVTGLTKKELAEKIAGLISSYIDKPTVSVMITDYRSKVYYVIGEVGNPGKYYMRSESITISEAAVAAGLPTLSAAMRKCRLITPGKNGKTVTKRVDLYSVLYGGDLDKDAVMRPGDYLNVPSTIMAKALRVISPVAAPVTSAASAQTGVGNIGSSPRN
jgi:protein involved in polysaccharide export with SLBB domain